MTFQDQATPVDETAEPPIANEHGIAITPFVQLAAVLARNPLDELAIEINRVVRAIQGSEAAKPTGTVTLTISVERSSKNHDVVYFASEVKAKLPKEPKATALLFADEDGVLSTRDPNQKDMFNPPRGI
jgi:hypothetical protein